ncbi:MAG: KH domain-containing protein, partial [Thermoleophilia bacterium]|nr:KH domain-containing protein [Thermoleophilia bacterium]
LVADIIVETESQKRIVVGRGGQMVRDIGASARAELGRLWGETVHLSLLVKVRKRWRDDESLLDRLGV